MGERYQAVIVILAVHWCVGFFLENERFTNMWLQVFGSSFCSHDSAGRHCEPSGLQPLWLWTQRMKDSSCVIDKNSVDCIYTVFHGLKVRT